MKKNISRALSISLSISLSGSPGYNSVSFFAFVCVSVIVCASAVEAALQARPAGWQRVLFGSTAVLSLGGGVLAHIGYETQGGIISVATGLVTFSAGATSNLVMYLCQHKWK